MSPVEWQLERTFVMIKPDAVRRKLVGEIVEEPIVKTVTAERDKDGNLVAKIE